jgi:hypothetical protein
MLDVICNVHKFSIIYCQCSLLDEYTPLTFGTHFFCLVLPGAVVRAVLVRH